MPADKFRTWKDVHTARLYHYQNFCPARLATMLRQKKIHCADPTRLNDPWDCKPWFHKRADGTGPAVSWDSLSEGIQDEIAKRRIYCLTPDPLSILMWSHYAADHTGICLEFHLSNLLFNKVMGVVYQEEFPAILPEEMYSRVHDVLLTKAKCWSYEEEFRLLGSPYIDENDPLRLHDNFLKLPDLALMSVIVGCKGEYDAVKQVVNDSAPGLGVIQVIRAPNEYKLLMGLAPDSEHKKKMLSWPRPLNAA